MRSVNLQKCTPVRTAVLIGTHNEGVALLGPAGLSLPVAGVEYSTGRVWAHRWRKRQRAAYTSLRNQEAVTTEQKEQKANVFRQMHFKRNELRVGEITFSEPPRRAGGGPLAPRTPTKMEPEKWRPRGLGSIEIL